MRVMPDTFRKYNAIFNMVKRVGNVCIYARKPENGKITYETVIAQIAKKDRIIDGVVVTAAGDEMYPSCEMWGNQGWTYPDLNTANLRLMERVELKKAKELNVDIKEQWYIGNNWPKNMRKASVKLDKQLKEKYGH